ncbi:MAG: DUF167 domain-containing protein [Candidatus Aenigmatarchaeota archaeon]
MIIKVTVQPKSGRHEVQPQHDGSLRLYLKSAPEGGKANQEALELLAEHFNVSKASVRLVTGSKSRKKAFEVIVEL